MTAARIELRGLGKRYGDVVAVRDIDLDIEAGELVVLLGPSGCGKTTVLRMIAGLEDVASGTVRLGDRIINDVEPADRDVAMVFQNYALYPHMSVRKNLEFGLRMRKTPREEIDRKVAWAAEILGLGTLLDRRPGQLSGGQRQRVALGRAMVREPHVFLFDEPLSNLDARLRLETRAEIAELHGKLGVTMVFVTHDQVEAMTLGQRIAVMKDGVLQQYDRPLEVYRSPANLFVATFIGTPSINTVPGTLVSEDGRTRFVGESFALETSHRGAAGAGVLGIRPEAITLVDSASEGATLGGRVIRSESLGNETLVHCRDAGGGSWIVRTDPEHVCRNDESVGLRLDPARVHLFTGPEMSRVPNGETAG